MSRWVPLDIFEQIDSPILVSGENGRIEYCNRAAGALFGCEPEKAIGQRCWEVTRLRGEDGRSICRERCSVQKQVCEGIVPESVPVFRDRRDGDPIALALFTSAVSPPRAGRVAVLHLLKPIGAIEQHAAPPEYKVRALDVLEHLTKREKEVLQRLAAGMSTEEVAATLFVSPTTVRNHVRSIFTKLHVHHRIEAVLAWLRRVNP